ncbi:MAG: hypothetical protein M5U22_17100 [Thermoleophilia bacterium]|nr:hypothetical protein [Thermoleophilia bacterium]
MCTAAGRAAARAKAGDRNPLSYARGYQEVQGAVIERRLREVDRSQHAHPGMGGQVVGVPAHLLVTAQVTAYPGAQGAASAPDVDVPAGRQTVAIQMADLKIEVDLHVQAEHVQPAVGGGCRVCGHSGYPEGGVRDTFGRAGVRTNGTRRLVGERQRASRGPAAEPPPVLTSAPARSEREPGRTAAPVEVGRPS